MPSRWRYGCLVIALAVYGAPLVTGRTFTGLGHFTSVLIGLACCPLPGAPHRRSRGGSGIPVRRSRRP
ncbi:rhomboid-like protein [Streptomyces yokosukanensis]|uniref:rhomboid-like protein n=1 Tax=Streptomyces yokosukanensis TaxID=67386 RepID=UPI00099F25DB